MATNFILIRDIAGLVTAKKYACASRFYIDDSGRN